MVCELLDLGGKTAGGDGDVTGSHAKVGRCDEEIQGGKEIWEICERFAHPHKNKIIGSTTCDT
jgi:hypothetical protein